MRVSFSRIWGPLFLLLGAACTVKTVDTSDGGTGGAGGTGGSGGSAGTSGAAGTGGTTDSGTDAGTGGAAGSSGSAGTAGTGGAAGNDGGSDSGTGGSAGSAGAGGSAGTDGGTDGGTGGTAGSGGTAGAAGAGGSAGTMDGGGADAGDPCATETTPNEDRDHATALALGAATRACLQTEDDIDFYEFTIPTTPVQGGFIKLQLTDVSTNTSLSFNGYAAADNGEFISGYKATEGASVFGFFAGKAGAKFRIKVARFSQWSAPAPYTITAVYTGVNDVNEPNDDNAHATNITIGTPVQGYMFAGYEVSTAPAASAWDDRFKVTVPEGEITFTLQVPADIDGQIQLYDSLGAQIDSEYQTTPGSTVVMTHTFTSTEAGVVYVSVHPFARHEYQGEGSTTFDFWSNPYTLTVTGP